MAFIGFKKQITKAEQYVNEKIGMSEGTKLDPEYTDLEARTDLLNELLADLQVKSAGVIQTNPSIRSKMLSSKNVSKLSEKEKNSAYPQVETQFGESLLSYGKKLTESTQNQSLLANCLITSGETMKKIGDFKYLLDDNVKSNFLEPIDTIKETQFKIIQQQRKKVQSRRLDFDGKRRRNKGNDEDELQKSEERFESSLLNSHKSMKNLEDAELEHINLLSELFKQLFDYHFKTSQQMQGLISSIDKRKTELSSRTKLSSYTKPNKPLYHASPLAQPKLTNQNQTSLSIKGQSNQNQQIVESDFSDSFASSSESDLRKISTTTNTSIGIKATTTTTTTRDSTASDWDAPCCKAIYEFVAENEGELPFPENAIITLKEKLDENWFLGVYQGREGHFPISYVNVINPLP